MPAVRRFTLTALLAAALVLTGCSADKPPSWPMIVAHRGGTADSPENTLLAIRQALADHADAIWLTVQLTRDGVPVLYRPADLSTNTNGRGAVASLDLNELERLNAGWNFARVDENGTKTYPYRSEPLRIPTLDEALRAIPAATPVMLDMKALPAAPQAAAVARVLTEQNAWQRVLLYSTDAAYQQAFAPYPQARMFESRDVTRGRLADIALAHACSAPPAPGAWTAFEYRRKMTLTETFTLGEARSPVDAKLWTPDAIACFRSRGDTHIVAIGIGDAEDYRAAACLGIDAILADSPHRMQTIRANMSATPACAP